MVDLASSFLGLVSIAFGMAMFLALLWWAATSYSVRWRSVAARYGGRPGTPMVARRAPDTIVIAPSPAPVPPMLGHRVHAGVAIAVHGDGLALTLLPPLGALCPPIFLPFEAMRLEPTGWGAWRDPFAIRLRDLPGIDVILAEDTVLWLGEHAGRAPFPAREP